MGSEVVVDWQRFGINHLVPNAFLPARNFGHAAPSVRHVDLGKRLYCF